MPTEADHPGAGLGLDLDAAMASVMKEAIDSELTEEVRSARLYKKKKSGKYAQPKQTEAWARFQKSGREMCDLFEHVCMLTTDITSYFEFIEVPLLVAELREVPGMPSDIVDVLARLLNGISKMGPLNGVPQGPEVSSLLLPILLEVKGAGVTAPIDHEAALSEELYGASARRKQFATSLIARCANHVGIAAEEDVTVGGIKVLIEVSGQEHVLNTTLRHLGLARG